MINHMYMEIFNNKKELKKLIVITVTYIVLVEVVIKL